MGVEKAAVGDQPGSDCRLHPSRKSRRYRKVPSDNLPKLLYVIPRVCSGCALKTAEYQRSISKFKKLTWELRCDIYWVNVPNR